MTMRKEKLSLQDYEKLKAFFDRYADWFLPKYDVPPESRPLAFLAELEKTSLANAKKGLQMAVNDIVEDTTDWTPDRLANADARLAAAGTFTLSEVRRRYSKMYLRILERGVIRSETEYYLVKGIVDGGGIEPGATEDGQLRSMLDAYDAKCTNQPGSNEEP